MLENYEVMKRTTVLGLGGQRAAISMGSSHLSPSGAGDHSNHNAETYGEFGNLLGQAMAEVLKK